MTTTQIIKELQKITEMIDHDSYTIELIQDLINKLK